MAYGRRAKMRSATTSKVMPHGDFIDRIRKTLYFGSGVSVEKMELSRPLAEYASEVFSAPHKGHSLNRLNTTAAGSVNASTCSLIMALIYLDRLNVTNPGYVRLITPQELFIVSMMISTKFYEGYDEEIELIDWAMDGNMTEKRLKKLELEFLFAIEWNIYISNEEFFEKLIDIEKQLARREGLRRGWLTYTELMQMLPSFTLAKFILNNIVVMVVSYAASVITIAGAFFLASQIPGTSLHRKTTSEVIGGHIAIQQSTPIDNYRAIQLDAQLRQRRINEIEISNPIAIGEGTVHNATCAALNVEAELLKLECQYKAEAQQEAIRRRQHEIDSSTRLTLPDAVQRITGGNKKSKNTLYTTRFGIEFVCNWLAPKVKHTDGGLGDWLQSMEELKIPRKDEHFRPGRRKETQYDRSMTDWNDWNLGNYTTSMFWQLFSDNAQQSFVRLPSMWLKFI